MSSRRAATWSLIYVVLALLYGVPLGLPAGWSLGTQFLAEEVHTLASGSSSSAQTRAMIRPTVSQSTLTIRLIVILSVRVARHATSCSKSRVKPLA